MFEILFLLNWPLEGYFISCMREERRKKKEMHIQGNRELPQKNTKKHKAMGGRARTTRNY